MKKLVSILVVSLFLTHFVGFYVYFVVRQCQIREEMREMIGQLPDEAFETFVFTKAEYQRIRVHDHEVKINGKMYDHSTPQIENDKVILHARHDEAEDNLIGFLKAVVSTATNDSEEVPSQITSFYTLDFIPPHTLHIPLAKRFAKRFCNYNYKILTAQFPVELPPPRV